MYLPPYMLKLSLIYKAYLEVKTFFFNSQGFLSDNEPKMLDIKIKIWVVQLATSKSVSALKVGMGDPN